MAISTGGKPRARGSRIPSILHSQGAHRMTPASPRARRCYDIPALLAREGMADMGRIKGDQRGSLVRIGRKYYARFSKWVVVGNKAEWKAVKEPLCATSEGKARAIELLNERVAEANGP